MCAGASEVAMRHLLDRDWNKPKFLKLKAGRMAFYLLPQRTTWIDEHGYVEMVRYGWLGLCVKISINNIYKAQATQH
jgi:hypothetical protein